MVCAVFVGRAAGSGRGSHTLQKKHSRTQRVKITPCSGGVRALSVCVEGHGQLCARVRSEGGAVHTPGGSHPLSTPPQHRSIQIAKQPLDQAGTAAHADVADPNLGVQRQHQTADRLNDGLGSLAPQCGQWVECGEWVELCASSEDCSERQLQPLPSFQSGHRPLRQRESLGWQLQHRLDTGRI
jgi:hypothetical protein